MIYKFICLEFITIKTTAEIKRLIICFIFATAVFVAGGTMGIIMLFPFLTMLNTFLFSAGKDGLDCLYASLSVSRKTVVMGRYLFNYISTLAIIIICFIIGTIVMLAMQDEFSVYIFLLMSLVSFFIATLFNAINMPILFKVGFKKTRMLAIIVPTGVIVCVVLIVNLLGIDTDREAFVAAADTFGEIAEANIAGVLFGVMIWSLVQIVSYSLSVRFYNKRDF